MYLTNKKDVPTVYWIQELTLTWTLLPRPGAHERRSCAPAQTYRLNYLPDKIYVFSNILIGTTGILLSLLAIF